MEFICMYVDSKEWPAFCTESRIDTDVTAPTAATYSATGSFGGNAYIRPGNIRRERCPHAR